eukprot:CAMPEP_0185580808 /NCGR_PEP_ID=MMETSP0434-20130131/17870_1 /TAXON_ID=626734 ORGANISM="Favella taraikaensis, Strain Fe Narragansett Bay" /NCGR_SAMPLE_ID=MMETSP0434 /ASSEMBLY_ACC=CAM_ASM_000379 /LENGTH=44 /DNA_ID= /DNA_START= /DNA_END= /DNA_ORIENTATION=
MCLQGGHQSAEKNKPTYLSPWKASLVTASVNDVSSRSRSVDPHF